MCRDVDWAAPDRLAGSCLADGGCCGCQFQTGHLDQESGGASYSCTSCMWLHVQAGLSSFIADGSRLAAAWHLHCTSERSADQRASILFDVQTSRARGPFIRLCAFLPESLVPAI